MGACKDLAVDGRNPTIISPDDDLIPDLYPGNAEEERQTALAVGAHNRRSLMNCGFCRFRNHLTGECVYNAPTPDGFPKVRDTQTCRNWTPIVDSRHSVG